MRYMRLVLCMSNYSYLLSDYFWLCLIVEHHAPQQ